MQQDSFDARLQGQKPEAVAAQAKSGRGWMVCSIISLLLLAGVSVYAVIATVGIQGGIGGASNDVATLKQEVDSKNQKLDEIKEIVGAKSIDEVTPELVTAKKYNSKYVYFPEAGMKVSLPQEIKGVSYLHKSGSGITFWAVLDGFQYAPDFADPEKNHGGLVAIGVSKKVDDKDKVCNGGAGSEVPDDVSCTGTYILDAAVDGYEIDFYGPHALYSSDKNAISDETKVVQALKDALMDPKNYSEI